MNNKLFMARLKALIVVLFFTVSGFGQTSQKDSKEYSADLIIYGGTSAAVTAAVEAVQSGKTVFVVSPDTHLGGLSSGGLGYSDTGNKSTIGGLSREFYHRVWLHYNDSSAWKWQKH